MEPTTGGTGMDVTAALTTVQTELLASAGEALPIAGLVFASIAGVMLAFKFFKKITGARA